ncbi:hypothetical protein C493_21786 [Natronolimnohabitans innermongolicus JCM 12255]|uniref:Uncharacterized protein n=1 Tax=Natronolimnohabitans innermongolicus JCM 12255 TaxID=1227499 RepID=L9WHN8_9EURY|nr:hypothetical protein C493_21786 [Natronolimnohabitans innermongolicus JCM 12255]
MISHSTGNEWIDCCSVTNDFVTVLYITCPDRGFLLFVELLLEFVVTAYDFFRLIVFSEGIPITENIRIWFKQCH